MDSRDDGRDPVFDDIDDYSAILPESSTRRTLVLIKGPLELLLLVVIPALLILLAVTITIVVLCVLCRRHGNGGASDRAAAASGRSGAGNIYTYQSANQSADGRAFVGALGGGASGVARVGSKTSSANDVELHFDFGRGVPVIFAEELEQLAPLGPIPPPFGAANNRTLQRNGARPAGAAANTRHSRSQKKFAE